MMVLVFAEADGGKRVGKPHDTRAYVHNTGSIFMRITTLPP
jgi:hypothetical protein